MFAVQQLVARSTLVTLQVASLVLLDGLLL